MPLEFTCPACQQALTAPFAAAGLAGSCKFCHARIIAPHAAGRPATLAPESESAMAAGAGAGSAMPPSSAGLGPAGAGASGGATGYAGQPGPGSAAPGYYPPGFAPPGETPMPPADLLANPNIGKAFLSSGRPAVADFCKRFLGFGIDMAIISGIQLALAAIMLTGMNVRPANVLLATRSQMGAALQFTMALFAAKVLYGAILEGSPLQATFGKFVLGMKVCTPETGERITFLNALWRNFCKWGTVAAVSFAPIIGIFPYAIFFYAMRDDMTQTLHDMCAGTVVADRSW